MFAGATLILIRQVFHSICVRISRSLDLQCSLTRHFRACACFFKRAKLSGKQYACRKGVGKCSTAKDAKFACRGCRFDKCAAVGMEYDGPLRVMKKQSSILKRVKMEFRALNERRREKELNIIKEHGGHTRYSHPTEILYTVRHDTSTEINRIFIVESYEFFNNAYPAFSILEKKERDLIFKQCLIKFSMIDNHQRSMRLWGAVIKYQTFSATTCTSVDFIPSEEERAVDANIDNRVSYTKKYVDDLNDIYLPIFTRCSFTEREYCALMTLAMSEIDCDLSKEAELILEKYRRETLEDLQLYYRNDLGLWNFSIRLGNLMTANHAVQESISLFKVFFRFYSIMFDAIMAENEIRDFYL
ncbi:hypothetical protein PRIPAC_81510 [Pristionchus pacificus]|nr:hypothetical protein PRIPAC_81510 [Pristionchus pacificus]